MPDTASGPPPPDGEEQAEVGYTAVVYFHGIGTQRRFEETSRLVDGLDRFAYLNEPWTGRLVRAAGRTEPSRIEDDAYVSYIELEHHHQDRDGEFVDIPYRFYEAYWAPITAGTSRSRQVVAWAFRQVANPIRPLLRGWRTQPRLHRTALYRLNAHWWPQKESPHRKLIKPLLSAYNEFENPEQLRTYPKGSFREFIEYLKTDESTNHSDVLDLARQWHHEFFRMMAWHQAVLTTLALAFAVGIGALLAGALLVLGFLADTELVTSVAGASELVDPTLTNALTLVVAILGVVGVAGFTRRYIGDVVAWATYEETDEKFRVRTAILDESVNYLWHVLRDPECMRVVVVGHSLGTTVANDALLSIGRHAYARRMTQRPEELLGKLDQFVTLASPVDTIHSMFESHAAKYHRYSRVFEGLRGDVGGLPFSDRRKPLVHWINVWDRADIISGPLFSPNQKRASAIPVDNVEVRSLHFPDPAASHVAYFDHHDVISLLFRTIFRGRYSFRTESPSKARHATPVPHSRTLGWQYVMLGIPWFAAAYGVSRMAEAGSLVTGLTGWGTLILIGLAAGGYVYSRTRGHRRPLIAEGS